MEILDDILVFCLNMTCHSSFFFSCNNINGCHHLNPSFMCCTTLFELFPCLLHFVFAYYLLTTQLHLYIIVLKYFSPKLHMLIVNDYILARILNF